MSHLKAVLRVVYVYRIILRLKVYYNEKMTCTHATYLSKTRRGADDRI